MQIWLSPSSHRKVSCTYRPVSGDVLAKPKLVKESASFPAVLATYLGREFATQTRREVNRAAIYRPVSGLSFTSSSVVEELSPVEELSSVLSVMDSRSISPSAMT